MYTNIRLPHIYIYALADSGRCFGSKFCFTMVSSADVMLEARTNLVYG